MPHLFRHLNGKLYTLEHTVKDIRYNNRGAFCGITAYPYNHCGEKLTHLRINSNPYNPKKFTNDNFKIVAEL